MTSQRKKPPAPISVEPIWLPHLTEKCHMLGCVRPGTNVNQDRSPWERLCDGCLSAHQTHERQRTPH